MPEECVFCRIVKGELPSAMVWEDDSFIAILDLFPNTKGMTLVIPKRHFDSYAFDMPEEDFLAFTAAARKVAKLLEKALGVKRVAMVMEGMGVNHAHYKLYPLHGLKDKYEDIVAEGRVQYGEYPGFVDTRLGAQADPSELAALAESIRNRAGKV